MGSFCRQEPWGTPKAFGGTGSGCLTFGAGRAEASFLRRMGVSSPGFSLALRRGRMVRFLPWIGWVIRMGWLSSGFTFPAEMLAGAGSSSSWDSLRDSCRWEWQGSRLYRVVPLLVPLRAGVSIVLPASSRSRSCSDSPEDRFVISRSSPNSGKN